MDHKYVFHNEIASKRESWTPSKMTIDDVIMMTHTFEYFFTNFRTPSFSSEKMKIIELVV